MYCVLPLSILYVFLCDYEVFLWPFPNAFYAICLLGFAKLKNVEHPSAWKHWFGCKLEVPLGVEALLDWETLHGVERLPEV